MLTSRQEEIKILWDAYRMDKAFGNQFTMILQAAIYGKLHDGQVDREYWLGETRTQEPEAGKLFWTETFEPPLWFGRMVEQSDFSDMVAALETARGPKTKATRAVMPGHSRKRERRQPQDESMGGAKRTPSNPPQDELHRLKAMSPQQFQTFCVDWITKRGYECQSIRREDDTIEIFVTSRFEV